MFSDQPSLHDKALVEKRFEDFFENITSKLAAKIGCDPVALDNVRKPWDGDLFTKRAIFEDPSHEKAFLVRVGLFSTMRGARVKVNVEIGMLSRQMKNPERLPTIEEVQEMPDIRDTYELGYGPSPLIFTKFSTTLKAFANGPLANNMTAEMMDALENEGPFDIAVDEAKRRTAHNIETVETLAKMQRLGWQPKETSRSLCNNGLMASGGRIIYAFRCGLTVEQANALHEAINDIMGDDREAADRQKIVTYSPR